MRFQRMLNVAGVHCEGEIGNVVIGGMPNIPGDTMLDKRNYLKSDLDSIRQLILKEPRGNVARNSNIVFPTNRPDADMGYVIVEPTEYPVMSGSNTICVATVLLETGMVEMSEPTTRLTLESPAGLIDVACECRDGKVTSVRFVNQPAFVYELDATVEVEGIGSLRLDVAWGGMAYAIVDASQAGFTLDPSEARELCEVGQRIKTAAAEQIEAVHPVNPEFPGITQVEWTNPIEVQQDVLTARNAVVVSPGRIDRSPCGTGTSARLAVLKARGEIGVGQKFVHESILGTQFTSVIESECKVGSKDGVIPSISGQAWITDFSSIVLDPSDPFPSGYTLADTWSYDALI